MGKILKPLFVGVVWVLFSAIPTLGDASSLERMHSALNDMGIALSGAIEVEAAYVDTDASDTSDITLATVELGVDVKPINYVSGHLTLLYEEDDTDLEVDQGYIRLDGEDKCPFYAEAGQLYLPFGNFDSHFVSDPLTLELGETRETALVLGYGNDSFDIALGVFNGDINEAGETDDMVDGFFANAVYTMPAKRAISLLVGLSYLSNIADSDGLTDLLATTDSTIVDYVPALAAFVSGDWNEKLFCKLEYVWTLDNFNSADLDPITFPAGTVEPRALNVEVAYAVTGRLEVGLRYGASDDAGGFLPESLYGVVARFAPIEHVAIALELQSGEYEDNSDITTATLQLALEF